MLASLARFLYAHRRAVLYVAVVGAVIAGVFGGSVAQHLSPYGANDPATQSVQASKRFDAAAHRQLDPGVVAVVRTPNVTSAEAHQRVGHVVALLRQGPDVAAVNTYYETHNPAMVSRDGRSTYVLAYFRPLSDSRLKSDAQQIEHRFSGISYVKLGGGQIANAQVNTQVSHDLARSELLAFPLVFLLSFLFFRSLVAALLPPLLGGLAIVATFLTLRIVAGFVDLSVFALNLTTGLGLGLAIDYSLFMVSRYREESAQSGYNLKALQRTLQTAGRTITFSSLTIAAAVASLTIFPQRFLYSMGVAGAAGRAAGGRPRPYRAAGAAQRPRPARERTRAQATGSRRRARSAAGRGRVLVPPITPGHAPAGAHRDHQRRLPDRARDPVLHPGQVHLGRCARAPEQRVGSPGQRHPE